MTKLTDEQRVFVEENSNLVHHVMHKYFPSHCRNRQEYEELSQQGFLGLCLATIRYNESVSSFSSYACSYIWGYIIRYLNRNTGWAFHIRKHLSHEHIPFTSLNIVLSKRSNEDSDKELFEVIPDNASYFDLIETYQVLLSIFDEISRKYGVKIFTLRLQGLNQNEISETLGISQTSVSRIICKAKKIYNMRV